MIRQTLMNPATHGTTSPLPQTLALPASLGIHKSFGTSFQTKLKIDQN
ncbi:hypothetical protein IWQ48_003566 [Labrenzia sp. EL_13]|nr:hypothetical protein [Labrenzia sp. EL_162]MBG6195392.1 hypothetical protein [Labrenzia sp. EL_159]MBG6202423.1 hypothetical protein [Labrenzia sp. EL_13]